MSDYYIRTPDREDSRGPFDTAKLMTLAEAGQLTENTLYYDDDKEEWMPLGANKELSKEVFPERGKLSLKPKEEEKAPPALPFNKTKKANAEEEEEEEEVNVEEMLAAADGETGETAHLKKKTKSLEKAASIGSLGIALMLILSAVFLSIPQIDTIQRIFEEKQAGLIINYPFIWIAIFDLLMALFLLLAATEVYPVIRGRAMLGLGFGVYLGWSLANPILIGASAAAGIGMLYATISRKYTTMILATILGIGGFGILAFLAFNGDFSGHFDTVSFDFVESN